MAQLDHFGSKTSDYDSIFHINQNSNIAPTISTRLNEHFPHEFTKKVNLKRLSNQLSKTGKTTICLIKQSRTFLTRSIKRGGDII